MAEERQGVESDQGSKKTALSIVGTENQATPVAIAKEFPSYETLERRDVKWAAETETSDERASRLRIEEAEAQHKLDEERCAAADTRRNQLIGLCFVLALILILFVMCVWIVFSKQYTADVEKWATVTLAAILTGSVTTILGFAVGKATAK